MVGEWFNETQYGWNEEKVRGLVTKEDANRVLSIKSCSKSSRDLM